MEKTNNVVYISMKSLNYRDEEISNIGIVRDIETKIHTKTKIINGRNFLEMDTRPKRYIPVDVLVATYFCPNPDYKRYVSHKNGNELDDRAKNLEWINYSDIDSNLEVKDLQPIYELTKSSEKIVKKWTHPEEILKKYRVRYIELYNILEDPSYKSKKSVFRDHNWIFASEYESQFNLKWKTYKLKGYKSVKICETGLVSVDNIKTYGYPTPEGLCINLQSKENGKLHKPVLVQNIVASRFLDAPMENSITVHKRLDTWNNSKKNLEYVDVQDCEYLGKFCY